MIFPSVAFQFNSGESNDLLRRMENDYAQSITINQSSWQQGDIDCRFMAGDQTIWNEYYGNLAPLRRQQFVFNRIGRVVNMMDGYQRRNRKSLIVVPRENGDQKTADQYTKVMSWACEQNGIYDTISGAFRGALISGMNLLQVWMDYREDPINGNIRVDNCAYNTFMIDPFFKKQDLSDCNFVWKRQYMTQLNAISLMPQYADIILALKPTGNGEGRDGKFFYMPESYNYGQNNLITYDEYYYRDFRTQKLVVDSTSGETMEWKGDDESLKQFIDFHPQLRVVTQSIPTTRVGIVVEGRVLYDGPNPMGIDQYPFVPVFAYYYPELAYFPYRVQSVVRGLRDANYLYNRRKIIELDILESQVNSGWIYKENALVDPSSVFLSGQGRGIALKEEAQMSDVQRIEAPQVPPSMIDLSRILAEEIQQISGVNEELLGSATDDKAGILSMLRQGAGLTTLQFLYDQLDNSQKLLGKLLLNLIQTNFTPGKIRRIIEEEPNPQFYDKAFGIYDAAVTEGMDTTTQKQMQFAQMMQLREMGINIPEDQLIQAATIQNKTEIIEAIKQQQQQAQQMQQMQMQVQMQQAQANIELSQARATADKGRGIERLSRVQENQALAEERRAEAVKDDNQAVLTMVKALKELQTLDLHNIEKILQLQQVVEAQKQQPAAEMQPGS